MPRTVFKQCIFKIFRHGIYRLHIKGNQCAVCTVIGSDPAGTVLKGRCPDKRCPILICSQSTFITVLGRICSQLFLVIQPCLKAGLNCQCLIIV